MCAHMTILFLSRSTIETYYDILVVKSRTFKEQFSVLLHGLLTWHTEYRKHGVKETTGKNGVGGKRCLLTQRRRRRRHDNEKRSYFQDSPLEVATMVGLG